MDGRGVPPVLLGLMLANLAVFALWHTWGLANPEVMSDHFVVSLDAVMSGRVWTLLTAEISHLDATHFLVNMLGLAVFGGPVAHRFGAAQTLALYAAGGLVASLAHLGWSAATGDPTGAIGASGAVYAIAIVFACLHPRATLLVFFLIPTPAWLAVAGFIALDVAGAFGAEVDLMGDGTGARTAHAAHLGGALVGALWYAISARRAPAPAGRTPRR